MTSKIDKADAQEWLESLQQVGEGWYRQVALAVRAGAHKALGMERRAFAQAIGQKMIDPTDAVVELYRESPNKAAIADVLGMSEHRVHNILVAQGVIEGETRPTGSVSKAKQIGSKGSVTPSSDAPKGSVTPSSDEVAALEAQVEALAAQVEGAKRDKTERERKLREDQNRLTDRLRAAELKVKLLEEQRDGYDDQEKARGLKETEAALAEMEKQILSGMAPLKVAGITGFLERATEGLVELRRIDALNPKVIAEIDAAHNEFTNELAVCKMTIPEGR